MLVTTKGSTVTEGHREATPSAVDAASVTWTISGEGATAVRYAPNRIGLVSFVPLGLRQLPLVIGCRVAQGGPAQPRVTDNHNFRLHRAPATRALSSRFGPW
jgi:hypothetical protein